MKPKTPCVLIGVTGCIAAYKSCQIVRNFQKAGVRCKVVMTKNATQFIGPTTMGALTREPVAVEMFGNSVDPIPHISLAQECDAFLIAPCTANVAAKIAHGIADDLLTSTALATRAPLVIAPAMNVAMYEAPATQDNLETLRRRGVRIIEAEVGYQACGDTGKGRMPEPEQIVAEVLALLDKSGLQISANDDSKELKGDLEGLSVMVTAGPTIEPIDAVRYISNRSSGKMGYAIAEAALARGAQVTLVSGPVALPAPQGARMAYVETACEMLSAAQAAFAEADLGVFTAAVADYRPAQATDRKLKKGSDDEALATIHLTENPDILRTLGTSKKPGQIVVGFAAETGDVVANAQAKLPAKGADIIVANEVSGGLVFGAEDNEAILVREGSVEPLPLLPKRELADRILDAALSAWRG